MKLRNIVWSSLIVVFLMIISPSCEKFLDVKEPIDKVVSTTVFSNDESARSAVLGIYGRMMENLFYSFNGSISVYTGLSSDEITNSIPDVDNDQFTANSLNSNNYVVKSQFWDALYNYVYHANACQEGLDRSTGVSPNVKSQLTGEVKFIRALCYFYLTNFFGDVPLQLTTDYRTNAIEPRKNATDVYQQIVLDLKDAQPLLPESYVGNDRVRPNKMVATAFLSRVYLYLKDWSNAEIQATTVINSGVYSLNNNLNEVFLFNSNETIWQLETILGSYKTAEGNAFVPYPAGSMPAYPITTSLENSFETNDARKTSWLSSSVIGSSTYFFPFKYHVKYAFLDPRKEYNIVFRLAEILLVRAEARAHLNNIAGAQSDLNMVRARAGLPNTIAIDSATLLSALEQERRAELFAEWGHRWFDLKRTNRSDAILSSLKAPNWQPTDILYPIPFSQLQLNPNLTQNQGY